LQQEIRRIDTLRKHIPSGDPFDTEYKRLYYCRYADDFLVGIIGSHQDAESVRQAMRRFIEETLKLTIAEEKSHIRHSKKGAIFVGYEVKTYSGDRIVKIKRGTRHTTFKAVSERIQLHIPAGKLHQFCREKRYGDYATTKATHRRELIQQSDAEIIIAFNGELRGLVNYYGLAFNVKTHMNPPPLHLEAKSAQNPGKQAQNKYDENHQTAQNRRGTGSCRAR
jgi:RNA-directed DNA polymerase